MSYRKEITWLTWFNALYGIEKFEGDYCPLDPLLYRVEYDNLGTSMVIIVRNLFTNYRRSVTLPNMGARVNKKGQEFERDTATLNSARIKLFRFCAGMEQY